MSRSLPSIPAPETAMTGRVARWLGDLPGTATLSCFGSDDADGARTESDPGIAPSAEVGRSFGSDLRLIEPSDRPRDMFFRYGLPGTRAAQSLGPIGDRDRAIALRSVGKPDRVQ